MCSPLKLHQRSESFTSLADSVEDDDNYDDLISAIPTRCGSMHSERSNSELIIDCFAPERGRPEFLKGEYEHVNSQYLAIEDLATRNTFLAERQELVKRIQEVDRKRSIPKQPSLTHICSSMPRYAQHG